MAFFAAFFKTESQPQDHPVTDNEIMKASEGHANTDTDTEQEEPKKHQQKYTWCLDNGHGSRTPGKRSPQLPDGRVFYEFEFNRDIVRRIKEQLDLIGISYFIVVSEVEFGDTKEELEERVRRANDHVTELPKIFVSIHSNAAQTIIGSWCHPDVSGVETWHYYESYNSRKIAAIFQEEIVKATGWKDRWLKSRPRNQFYVLRHTNMPAILTENGFYNNLEQCLQLMQPDVRQKIADAHVAAILKIENHNFVI